MEVAATIGGAIGNAILSSFVEGMLEKLTSLMELNKYAGEEKVLEDFKKWKMQLKRIYVVLDDAVEKQWSNQLVEKWVSDLRDLAYDVEDVLDELATEAQRRKRLETKAAETLVSASKLRRIISNVKFSAEMVCKIKSVDIASHIAKSIGSRFNEIFKDKDDLNFGGSTSQVRERLPTTSLLEVGEGKIYGRDDDKVKIIELLKDEATHVNVSVISIVGMGGVGKTSLAQLIFNDTSLEFDFKAWASVGEDFDVLKITREILQPANIDRKDLNWHQMKLKEKLHQKKCLIVLDDLWNKSYDRWTLFCVPFQGCRKGSRILVTTRNQSVSLMIGSISAYFLKELSQDECLSVFAQDALGRVNFESHLHLEYIGRGIARRCQGLPLAAKALGGLLRGRLNRDDWEKVLNSNIWDLPDECNILPALRLSYFHLPFHLKQCFAYCAAFPKDFEFHRNELVLLWMAEGFVNEQQNMLELGCQYFDDLLSRSFFQVSSGDKSQYVMHGLIHDLAQSISGETCFHLCDKQKNTDILHAKIRYSSFFSSRYDTWQKFKDFSEIKNLRTFLTLPIMPNICSSYLTSKVLQDMVPKLKSLRVLSLAGYRIVQLPSSIGALKRLKYFNLSYTEIQRLPESIVDLLNLQTLRLRECSELAELPEGIGNLTNLRCLDISGCFRLASLPFGFSNLTNLQCLDVASVNRRLKMPPQIGNLRNLNMLTNFIVGKDKGVKLTELKKLSKLQGKLCIRELQNLEDIRDAEFADLKEKHGIKELELEWSEYSRNPCDDEVGILSSLRPHQNLSIISIKGFDGSKFPSWMADPAFNNMVKLSLWGCRNITSLPPLGQIPSLQDLSIGTMERVKEVGVELYGHGSPSFSSLQTLLICNMEEWEQWSCFSNDQKEQTDVIRFPKLHDLAVYNCPKLVSLPTCLPALQKLCVGRSRESLLRSISDFSSLTDLEIKEISGLVSLDEMHIENLVAIQDLSISKSDELLYLWKDGTNLENLSSLKRLYVKECGQVVSLVEEEEGKLPCNLQLLEIDDCKNLEKLANGLHQLTCLRYLKIERCNKLKSFPARGVPYSLRYLKIFKCNALEWLPEGVIGNQMCQLEQLIIRDCSSLASSPNGKFPNSLLSISCRNWPTQLLKSPHTTLASPNLAELKVGNCSQLEKFPEAGLNFYALISLSIYSCENLMSLPSNLSSLRSLIVKNCNNLRSLPDGMRNLTSLKLCNCPLMESFGEGGLPLSLTELHILDCQNLKEPMSEWGLHKLTSLSELETKGTIPSTDMLYSFPDDNGTGLILPTSLSSIKISYFKNLKFISEAILNLTSLRSLHIWNCSNLRSFPETGFPPSLGQLCVKSCPLTKEWCLKHRFIKSHIPSVET